MNYETSDSVFHRAGMVESTNIVNLVEDRIGYREIFRRIYAIGSQSPVLSIRAIRPILRKGGKKITRVFYSCALLD